jgi:uncharacterized membrane protein
MFQRRIRNTFTLSKILISQRATAIFYQNANKDAYAFSRELPPYKDLQNYPSGLPGTFAQIAIALSQPEA